MKKSGKPRVRLVDVAQAAGVSPSTASRALGYGSELISAETKKRVQEVARELGYTANPIARSLRLSSTGAIGMIVPSITNPFFMELVAHVEEYLAQRGMTLRLSNSRTSLDIEAAQLQTYESGGVDGLLAVPCHEVESAKALRRVTQFTPVVQLDRPSPDHTFPSVGVDDTAGVRDIIEHLKSRGTRSLALLTNTNLELSSITRVTAVRETARTYGLSLRPEHTFEASQSIEGGTAAIRQLLKAGPLPDAIVCLNDLLAIGAITELRRNGIDVPGDVMVTGYDDNQFASLVMPSLTTLRQPLARIAEVAVEMLLGERLGESRVDIRGELIIRESTTRAS
ncbi:MAG: LacI family transcriptional regulator [Actinobacteria bacterium]|nr:MAG: LacI family transcriptional regulator [Actinomycetota bacterium]